MWFHIHEIMIYVDLRLFPHMTWNDFMTQRLWLYNLENVLGDDNIKAR